MQTRASVLIECMPKTAFDFVANAANDHQWRSHLASSHGHATAVGDRITQTYSYQGKSQTIELEVAEFEPPERLSYVIHKPARARFAFQFRAEGGATRVSMSVSASLSGPAALFEGRVQSEAEKLLRTDLDRLKHVLEQG